MKKILVFICLSFMSSAVLADSITIDNKTSYPEKQKAEKIAVQWADSAKAVQNANESILNGATLNSSLTILTQKGKSQLISPNDARYFRIVVWTNGKQEPDLLTNWVDIIPNKNYVVNQSQLIHKVLMVGVGC